MKNKLARLKSARKIRAKIRPGEKHRLSVFKTTMHTYAQLFSPKGDIYALRRGSTPIDFAYEVHTDLGDSIVGCKVNRSEVPLNIELETGQTVEIITSKTEAELDPSWLNYVVTSKARSAIRAKLIKQKVSDARKAGKIMLETELKRGGKSLKEYRGGALKKILDSIGVTSLNKLMTDLGLGKRTGSIIAERFYSGLQIREGIEEPKPVLILDNKIESVTVRFAKCCLPVPVSYTHLTLPTSDLV